MSQPAAVTATSTATLRQREEEDKNGQQQQDRQDVDMVVAGAELASSSTTTTIEKKEESYGVGEANSKTSNEDNDDRNDNSKVEVAQQSTPSTKATVPVTAEEEVVVVDAGDDGDGCASSSMNIPGINLPPSSTTTQQEEDEETEKIKPFDRIYFLHMRKAGGTSLRYYMEHVARNHGVPIKFQEGWKYAEIPPRRTTTAAASDADDTKSSAIAELDNNNQKNGVIDLSIQGGTYSKHAPNLHSVNHTTLYVTHIREPISRIISHYKYEIRWSCNQQLEYIQAKSPTLRFEPSLNNTLTTFNEFITQDYQPAPKRALLWVCNSNCYSKWFTGYHPKIAPYIKYNTKNISVVNNRFRKPSPSSTNSTNNDTSSVVKILQRKIPTYIYDKHYNETYYKQQLQNKVNQVVFGNANGGSGGYHIIIVVEWLQKYPNYRSYLEKLFNTTGIKKRKSADCEYESHLANAIAPLPNITQDDMNLLTANNQIDIQLYNDIIYNNANNNKNKCGSSAKNNSTGGDDGGGPRPFVDFDIDIATVQPIKFASSSQSSSSQGYVSRP